MQTLHQFEGVSITSSPTVHTNSSLGDLLHWHQSHELHKHSLVMCLYRLFNAGAFGYDSGNTGSGPVFSNTVTSYVRSCVNVADSYIASKIRQFVFSKGLRIFAAFKNFGQDSGQELRKSREVLFALQRARSVIFRMLCRLPSAHMFWL